MRAAVPQLRAVQRLRAVPRLQTLPVLLIVLLALANLPVHGQAADGDMSEVEVESLRDSAYVPQDRVRAYEKILDAREKRIEELLTKPHHPEFAMDMHDALEQFGAIADELNDNLDDYESKHRDVRKVLPRLIDATERWSTALRATGDDDHYKIVRRTALDAVNDMRTTAETMQTTLAAYFKDHPEAVKSEKARSSDPHAPHAGNEPQ